MTRVKHTGQLMDDSDDDDDGLSSGREERD